MNGQLMSIYRTIAKYPTEIETHFLQHGHADYKTAVAVNAGWVIDLICDEQESEAKRLMAEFKKSRIQAAITHSVVKTNYCPPKQSTGVSYRETRHYAWLRKP